MNDYSNSGDAPKPFVSVVAAFVYKKEMLYNQGSSSSRVSTGTYTHTVGRLEVSKPVLSRCCIFRQDRRAGVTQRSARKCKKEREKVNCMKTQLKRSQKYQEK
jgi:hypothetical protein